MKKLLVSSVVALAMASSAVVAEESGAFVGLGLNMSSFQTKMTGLLNTKTTASGFEYEIVAGYKYFMTQDFGVRGYAHLNHNQQTTKIGTGTTETLIFNYGVNVDALYNFVSQENVDFGAFAGVRLGMNTVGGDAAKPAGVEKNAFFAGINLGLRGNFAKAHGVELAFLVPVTDHTLMDTAGVKMTQGYDYKGTLRYTYSF
ncbi:outer membrane beta-barrel protein [Helicobacter labetoulli]|uniref:outer membrane beta-barrel protein n=1 Tax=Helicobacter labetoulli TaxID=2315333 RepID=UPI000EF68360|nr:outer membrane beta-barrel protein [Helicobacter labetoulli]